MTLRWFRSLLTPKTVVLERANSQIEDVTEREINWFEGPTEMGRFTEILLEYAKPLRDHPHFTEYIREECLKIANRMIEAFLADAYEEFASTPKKRRESFNTPTEFEMSQIQEGNYPQKSKKRALSGMLSCRINIMREDSYQVVIDETRSLPLSLYRHDVCTLEEINEFMKVYISDFESRMD